MSASSKRKVAPSPHADADRSEASDHERERTYEETSEALAPASAGRSPSVYKVAALFFGIPAALFILIYVLRDCLQLW